MKIIYDYQGLTTDNVKVFNKKLEFTQEDKPIILEYLKEHYPEWWEDPNTFPLPKVITLYFSFGTDLVSCEFNTELLED